MALLMTQTGRPEQTGEMGRQGIMLEPSKQTALNRTHILSQGIRITRTLGLRGLCLKQGQDNQRH